MICVAVVCVSSFWRVCRLVYHLDPSASPPPDSFSLVDREMSDSSLPVFSSSSGHADRSDACRAAVGGASDSRGGRRGRSNAHPSLGSTVDERNSAQDPLEQMLRLEEEIARAQERRRPRTDEMRACAAKKMALIGAFSIRAPTQAVRSPPASPSDSPKRVCSRNACFLACSAKQRGYSSDHTRRLVTPPSRFLAVAARTDRRRTPRSQRGRRSTPVVRLLLLRWSTSQLTLCLRSRCD